MQLRLAPPPPPSAVKVQRSSDLAGWKKCLAPSPNDYPPTPEALHPRKQWAQKRNFKNAKPGGLSLLGANLQLQALNQNLEGKALSLLSTEGVRGVNEMKTVYYKGNLNI